jgi:hypothetical protein
MMSESDVLAGLTRRGMLQRLMANISEGIYFKDAPTATSLRKNTPQRRSPTAQPVIGIEEKERVAHAYDVFPR